MAKLQVSEKKIKNNYIPLEEYLNKELLSSEADLFYNDGKVYKIFKLIYRRGKKRQLELLEEHKFANTINIEDSLYQRKQLIGCTTIFDQNFITLKDMLHNKFDLYILKEYLTILLNLDQELAKYNLVYIDKHLENIGLSQGNLKVLDLDGVYFSLNQSYKLLALKQSYHVFLEMLLHDYNLLSKKNFLKTLPFDYSDIDQLQKFINNLSSLEAQDLQHKYQVYKKIKSL